MSRVARTDDPVSKGPPWPKVEPVTEATYDEAMEKIATGRSRLHGNDYGDDTGFDVVCTIGRVEFGKGDKPPIMAAFELVYEYDNPGTFRFPDGFGDHVTVIVPERPND